MALRLIQCGLEFCPRDSLKTVGSKIRGIYVLYKKNKRKSKDFRVLYVGMTDKSIWGRLRTHARKRDWTHFSAYAVWPNITKGEIQELEGIFRHLYRRDHRASVQNLQRGYEVLRDVVTEKPSEWQEWTGVFYKRKHRGSPGLRLLKPR